MDFSVADNGIGIEEKYYDKNLLYFSKAAWKKLIPERE
jgi:light-regulated signal transduction histidine kinase (bacteriophytochrome)